MAENSKIEWTHHTFNPWMGCSKVHTGCAHCYAEELMDNRYGKAKWGPQGTRVRTTEANWRKPLQWDRAAASAGERHRVFCASLADIFENWDGDIVDSKGRQLMKPDIQRRVTMDDMRVDLFRLIDATPHLDWLLLTKRPENVRRMWPEIDIQSQQQADDRNERGEMYRRNVWLGTSVSDQETADKAVPKLLDCRDLSPVLFLSAEPLVGAVDLTYLRGRQFEWWDAFNGQHVTHSSQQNCPTVDWVIAGGESGVSRRPMELRWAEYLRDQCRAADVPFFMKQIDKVQPIPDDLMIREFPEQLAVTAK